MAHSRTQAAHKDGESGLLIGVEVWLFFFSFFFVHYRYVFLCTLWVYFFFVSTSSSHLHCALCFKTFIPSKFRDCWEEMAMFCRIHFGCSSWCIIFSSHYKRKCLIKKRVREKKLEKRRKFGHVNLHKHGILQPKKKTWKEKKKEIAQTKKLKKLKKSWSTKKGEKKIK